MSEEQRELTRFRDQYPRSGIPGFDARMTVAAAGRRSAAAPPHRACVLSDVTEWGFDDVTEGEGERGLSPEAGTSPLTSAQRAGHCSAAEMIISAQRPQLAADGATDHGHRGGSEDTLMCCRAVSGGRHGRNGSFTEDVLLIGSTRNDGDCGTFLAVSAERFSICYIRVLHILIFDKKPRQLR